jgi:hypothetical protein
LNAVFQDWIQEIQELSQGSGDYVSW